MTAIIVVPYITAAIPNCAGVPSGFHSKVVRNLKPAVLRAGDGVDEEEDRDQAEDHQDAGRAGRREELEDPIPDGQARIELTRFRQGPRRLDQKVDVVHGRKLRGPTWPSTGWKVK